MTGLPTFDKLRLKTDLQLIQLVNRELDLGIRHANQALKFADDWEFAERSYLMAKKAYSEATRMLSLVGELARENRVDTKFVQLRDKLDALSVIESNSAPTKDEVEALARALWKARGCPEGLPEDDWFQAERALKLHTACVGN